MFECEADRLIGVLHQGAGEARTGVVIVVGGPQYRVGSHRQFVVTARRLASAGVPVLRFDARGMGDSEGTFPTFEALNPDIRAAVDALVRHVPSISGAVLLGLCDAASAILMYAASDPRIRGLILMNPWVRTTQGEAKAYLRHYYLRRLLQKSFWRKVASREFAPLRSTRDLLQSFVNTRGSNAVTEKNFIDRMLVGWEEFRCPVLLAISGRDLTAREFVDFCTTQSRWKRLMSDELCLRVDYPTADHTMSDERDLLAFSDRCIEWVLDEL